MKIINDNIRSSDTAFRYGGEEFAVILENTDEAAAYRIGERIVNSFYTMNNNSEFGDDKFSLSAGVVEFLLEEYTASELFEAADSALYYAKNHGKNRCIRFSDIKNLSE